MDSEQPQSSTPAVTPAASESPQPIPPANEAAPQSQAGPSLPQTPAAQPLKTKKTNFLFLVLILLTLGGLAIFFGYKFILKSKSQGTITPAPYPIESRPTPTPDETANWKTYTNSVHGITFKYPPTWQVDSKGDQDPLNAQLTLTKDQAKIKMYFNMNGIGGQGQTYQGKPFDLDGNSLFRFVKTNSFDNTQMVGISTSLTNTLGVFEVNGKTYSITLAYPVSDSQTEIGNSLEKEFDQILSTFQFTD